MPSQPTAYVVFEEVKIPDLEDDETAAEYRDRVWAALGLHAWKPIANEDEDHGHFMERDHKGAIDLALAGREAEDRTGGFAAAPARNWREFDFTTKVDYVTQAAERNGHAPELAPEAEPAAA